MQAHENGWICVLVNSMIGNDKKKEWVTWDKVLAAVLCFFYKGDVISLFPAVDFVAATAAAARNRYLRSNAILPTAHPIPSATFSKASLAA